MFDLDLRLFYFIYNQCRSLGSAFGFGAFEGFIMYLSIIMLAVSEVMNKKGKKCSSN